jgi:hypothetical protein
MYMTPKIVVTVYGRACPILVTGGGLADVTVVTSFAVRNEGDVSCCKTKLHAASEIARASKRDHVETLFGADYPSS